MESLNHRQEYPFLGRTRLVLVLLYIFAQTAVWSFISICLFVFDSTGRLTHRLGARPWARVLLLGSRVRLRVRGTEHIVGRRDPLVLVSNHQSQYDILALLAGLPVDFKFVVKKELEAVPLWGYAMKKAGYLFIDRGDKGKAIELMKEAAEKIRSGSSVLFFAEGTRSGDGELMPFKRGAFILASMSGCDVAPVVVEGSREVLPKGSMRVRPGVITVTVLPPVSDPAIKKNSKRLMSEVRQRMLDHMAKTRLSKAGSSF